MRLVRFLFAIFLTVIHAYSAEPVAPKPGELALAEMERIADDVFIGKVVAGLWVFTTYEEIDGAILPLNGALLETDDGSVLIDTASSTRQAAAVLDWAANKIGKPVKKGYVTHHHADRVGGITELARRGIPVFAQPKTIELAGAKVGPLQPLPLSSDGVLYVPGMEFFYPGPAHSDDNIVVFFPNQQVLFGGCMVRSTASKKTVTLDDAYRKPWLAAAKRLKMRYGAPFTIPGHRAADTGVLAHTIASFSDGK
jgi:glyoxylase-like metal-dependent hydrolase (beta-lactamase superfamily II)